MYKKYYQLFLKANQGVQHYASHSHHYWPDVTREAMLKYWDDSAKFVDDKWNHIFGERIPCVQKMIAEHLKISHPEQIVFAPNTHEFVTRLLSCFPAQKKIRILTTDSEFYSFDRQINRLQEEQNVEVVKVATQPFESFEQRFSAQLKEQNWDLVFFSQVFFNSGVVVKNLNGLVNQVTNPQTIIAVDGYHGFMAVPTDLSAVENRIFYLAGSYKYAQGGEGCCFMAVPKNTELRPANTGWFAGFSGLATQGSSVVYSQDGYRFAGSTMDFAALYRLQAVLELFKQENVTVEKIHEHIQILQKNFLADLKNWSHPKYTQILNEKNLLALDLDHHGHFLTFETQDVELTKKMHDEFYAAGIRTDYRGSRWRFGFGLYQEAHIDLQNLVRI